MSRLILQLHLIINYIQLFQVTEARLYYPDSIRARYGRRGEDFKNAVHGSNTRQEAEKEIHFFFPDCIDSVVTCPFFFFFF